MSTQRSRTATSVERGMPPSSSKRQPIRSSTKAVSTVSKPPICSRRSTGSSTPSQPTNDSPLGPVWPRLTVRLQTDAPPPAPARILGAMKTILVVDDERNIVDLLRLYLEKEGFGVVAAADGEQALALQRRHDPDLV